MVEADHMSDDVKHQDLNPEEPHDKSLLTLMIMYVMFANALDTATFIQKKKLMITSEPPTVTELCFTDRAFL